MLRIFQKPQHLFCLNFSAQDCILFPGKVQNVSWGQTCSVSRVHYSSKFSSNLKSSSSLLYQSQKLLQGWDTCTNKISLYSSRSADSKVDGRNEDIEYVMKMILKKMKKVGGNVIEEDYAKMAQKLKILHHHGCIITHVPEFLGVLNLSEEEIKKQAKRLQSASFYLLTPDLFLETHASKTILKRKALYQLKTITGIKHTEDLLKVKFDCQSKKEWNDLQPYLHRNQEAVSVTFFKVDYLQQQGLSIEEIKKHPKVLKLPPKLLAFRMERLQQMFPFVSPQTRLLMCELKPNLFYNLVSRKQGLQRYRGLFEGCNTKDEAAKNLFMYDNIDVDVEELNEITMKDLYQLKKKTEYLMGVGISPLYIVENIYCLRMGVPKLKKVVKETKEKYGKVESECLMSEIFKNLDQKKRKPIKLSKTTSKHIQGKLQLTEKELEDLCQSMSVTRSNSFYPIFLSKVNFLLEEGYSIADMKGCLPIFKHTLDCIKQRLKKMRKGDNEGQPSLELLLEDKTNIRKGIEEYWSSLGHSKFKEEALAELLQVEKLSTDIIKPLKYMKLKHLRTKIEYLLGIGIKPETILDDILCLKISLQILQNSVEELQKVGKGEITLMQITRLAYKMMPANMNVFYKANLTFIQDKLSLTEKDMELIQSKYLRNSSKVLQSNLKLLINGGFTVETLRSCPYIIAHSSEVLKEYLDKLHTMEDLQMYEDLLTDKKKLVNLLQYLIEKNNYFCRVVNDDETLGDDEALVSLYYMKDGRVSK